MHIGLRRANQQFAKVIRAVRSGRDIVLTDRGRALAVIRRIPAEDDDGARVSALAAEGLVAPAAHPGPMPLPRWQPERISTGLIAETVRRDRDETA